MTDTLSANSEDRTRTAEEQTYYTRFSLSQRVEHLVLLVSFTILGITGLAQKYATSTLGEATLGLFGGIQMARIIHRSAAVALMVVSIYHIIAVLYRVIVLRADLSILPSPRDFQHLFQDILYYVGRRARKAYYGRYTYAEKVEYFAVVWGTVIMAITGFMMWNPIATTEVLPGEFIPAAKAAHGGEALLAVLAIILWHFYHVHLRHFNKSMFTGKLSEKEMEDEHPAELARIKAGEAGERPPQEVIRRRQRFFIPAAAVLTAVLGYGLFLFVTFEETAIATVPPGETAPVFVPVTPTPSPVPPTLTPIPEEAVEEQALASWDGGIGALIENRCGACHTESTFANLSLATYPSTLEGGNSGPAVVPFDPQASVLVQVQQAGGHPGQLTEEELAQVIAWIEAGAPEEQP